MARPTTIEELADRLEIDELFNRYVTALDDNTFDLLETVFTQRRSHLLPRRGHGGRLRGRSMTGSRSNASISGCGSISSGIVAWCSMVTMPSSVSTFFFVAVSHDGNTFFTGGEYHDKLVRTADGWRIADRIERNLWNFGDLPDAPEV